MDEIPFLVTETNRDLRYKEKLSPEAYKEYLLNRYDRAFTRTVAAMEEFENDVILDDDFMSQFMTHENDEEFTVTRELKTSITGHNLPLFAEEMRKNGILEDAQNYEF